MKTLLVTPPLTQLNTSYPATCQLTGFLQSNGLNAEQMDLSIELINLIFSSSKLQQIFDSVNTTKKLIRKNKLILQNSEFYIQNIDAVVNFLSGNDNSLSMLFNRKEYWELLLHQPNEEDIEWAFGIMGNFEKATHYCTLFLKDICSFINSCIDQHFELIKYAESLCLRLPEFKPLHLELQHPLSIIDEMMIDIFSAKINLSNPDLVCFSIPFPGNLYSALRCCQWIKKHHPNTKICMGGGYVNTELREISDGQIFDYIDYLIFDDGELPLLRLIKNEELIRTIYRSNSNELIRKNFDSKENVPFNKIGTPTYKGLSKNKYINLIELTNPMHALWSYGKWNKIQLAHGCYWKKCTFCDVELDYINRYEPSDIASTVDKMETIMQETGYSGFHFVDEAAPPTLLKKMAEEILRRKLKVTYWTNVRFEKTFTPELCYLLSKSGCIAVSGGLEVASPRILKLINKGITIETAQECMKNFSESGIMTHAYLMYGFPTQTESETIQSLEIVRDLFEKGWLQSAFWHRYAMTKHSPSGKNPACIGAEHIPIKNGKFANNEIPFSTKEAINFDFYAKGLNLATYNYMKGMGYDIHVKNWFKENML